MTIRTYRGNSISEALTQVKRDLGANAVILHTRTHKVGGVLGLGARTITEITATADMHVEPRLPRRRQPAPPPAKAVEAATDSAPRPVSPDSFHDQVDIPAATLPARPVARSLLTSDNDPSIRDELAAIRRLVGHVLETSRAGAQPAMPEALFDCYTRMIESEVAAELADQIVAGVRDELRTESLRDEAVVRDAVLQRLAAHIPVWDGEPAGARAPDGRPLTIALIGPTGVGKTTTLAKLAATYRLRHARRVGLVTCDTYRIAAVEQLRTYANIIGLPLKVVQTPQEMADACAALSDCDVILVDTAGRSQRNTDRLEELAALLGAADPHQTHLVLSSAASAKVLDQAVENFSPLAPDHVIFTKLDEAVSFGVIVNVARRVGAKLSFLTTGQEVPDQIEAGDAHRIARLVVFQEDVP